MAMAASNELIREPVDPGSKGYGGQRKRREELEREVAVLETMLSNEEKIREILQKAYNRKPGMEFIIPNDLPSKTKEVLAELILFEDEIVRLEKEIDRIQKETKIEKTATNEVKTKKQHNHDQLGTVYENKALHFISKAIQGGAGGYSLNDFTINNDKMTSSPSVGLGNSSRNVENQKGGLQDRGVVKRSGGGGGSGGGYRLPGGTPLREFRHPPASPPLRDFRHPTPKPPERNTEIRQDPPRKAVSGPAKLEDNTNTTKIQPNKLSENIMKTLILLYVRLIRTSRQSELEKSGPISRSLFSTISFRTESSSSLSASVVVQKLSQQLDPYGVFDVDEAVRRDIGPYKNLVVFTSSSLESKYVSHSSSIPLLQKLRGLFGNLQKVEVRSLTDEQKLAFWINIYNACIMHGYLKFGVPSSQEKLLSLLNKATLNVGGKIVNAQAIERCILRKPTLPITKENEIDSKEAIIHEQYGLKSVNPNVIFGLCCGTRSSPAVRIYTAEGVKSELEKSKLEYLLASISITSSRKIRLPELLTENMNDFAIDMDSMVDWVCQELPTSGSLRKSIVDCFKSNKNDNNVSVEKMSYEFEFQYLLQV